MAPSSPISTVFVGIFQSRVNTVGRAQTAVVVAARPVPVRKRQDGETRAVAFGAACMFAICRAAGGRGEYAGKVSKLAASSGATGTASAHSGRCSSAMVAKEQNQTREWVRRRVGRNADYSRYTANHARRRHSCSGTVIIDTVNCRVNTRIIAGHGFPHVPGRGTATTGRCPAAPRHGISLARLGANGLGLKLGGRCGKLLHGEQP